MWVWLPIIMIMIFSLWFMHFLISDIVHYHNNVQNWSLQQRLQVYSSEIKSKPFLKHRSWDNKSYKNTTVHLTVPTMLCIHVKTTKYYVFMQQKSDKLCSISKRAVTKTLQCNTVHFQSLSISGLPKTYYLYWSIVHIVKICNHLI